MEESLSAQIRQASADLRAMSTEVRREVRPALQKAAEPMIRTARSNAAWSRRIPRAIKLSVLKRGVEIRVSKRIAPHARPLEGIRGNRTFRHPFFGNREVWFDQKTRPFLTPAVRKHRREIVPLLAKVIEDAAKRHGYR